MNEELKSDPATNIDLMRENEQLRAKLAQLEQQFETELASGRRARLIIDTMYQFIGLLDIEGRVLEVNKAALTAASTTNDEIIGQLFWLTPWWIGLPETQEKLRDAIERAAKGEFVRFEAEHFSKETGKDSIYVDFSLTPIFDENNKVIYLLPEGRDITEKKKAEAELACKNEELAQKHAQLEHTYQRVDRIFSALTDALPGTVLDGKYRLDSKIGSGGYGTVFRGLHISLNRPIAVKVFRPNGGATLEDLVRFQMEGISTSRVNHNNAIAVLDAGVSLDSVPYLVMELLQGHTLTTEMCAVDLISPQRFAEIILPVCDVLAKAHSMGVVHRDIKPDNIFLHQGEEGEVIKVLDFGIAKLLNYDQSTSNFKDLTTSDMIIGTPAYMSPERLTGKPYDGKADVYSLGIVMYQMLTGTVPFDPDTSSLGEVIYKHLVEMPPAISEINKNVPVELDDMVMKALAKTPDARPDAAELTDFIKEFLNSNL